MEQIIIWIINTIYQSILSDLSDRGYFTVPQYCTALYIVSLPVTWLASNMANMENIGFES